MISVGIALLQFATIAANPAAQVLPTSFEAGRVYVTPQTADGTTLKFFTDSGGATVILDKTVSRLKLPTQAMPKEYGDDAKSAKLPAFKSGLGIPSPLDLDGQINIAHGSDTHFDIGDGMLGEAWFGGRIWTWDYPQHTLTLETAAWKPSKQFTRVALGFPVDEKGARGDNFARITVRIDGKPIDLLLDTGATTVLTAPASPPSRMVCRQHARRASSPTANSRFGTRRIRNGA